MSAKGRNHLDARKVNYLKKVKAIQAKFQQLYSVDRKRIDDVYLELEELYAISNKTLTKILKTRIVENSSNLGIKEVV